MLVYDYSREPVINRGSVVVIRAALHAEGVFFFVLLKNHSHPVITNIDNIVSSNDCCT